jgi:CelD/BcsL family acetyltransferase involved in cellulose biosynthesis
MKPIYDSTAGPLAEGPAKPSCPALRLEVFRDWESVALFEPEWDRFAQEVGGDIYLSAAWGRVWWRHYGRGSLRILAVRHGDDSATPGALAAIFPMFISRIWLGPVALRIAKFVSADSTIVVLSPPVHPELAEPCYRFAIGHLLGEAGCDAVSFGPLAGDVDRCEPIRRACGGAGAPGVLSCERTVGVHTVFPLPHTFDGYLQSLGKMFRSNLRRNLNGLSKNFGFASRAITDPAKLREHFPAFLLMHTEQWTADRRLGHFGDWPGSLEFSKELVRELAPLGRVSLVCLTASDRPVSYYWNFTYGRRAFWRLPARESGRDWDKFGLGRVGLVMMIEAMIAKGLQSVEGGPGHYEYKLQHGAAEYPLRSVLVARRSPYVRAATRLAAAVSDGFHFVYYRAWRGKVIPRMNLKYRPLWKSWIRTRL